MNFPDEKGVPISKDARDSGVPKTYQLNTQNFLRLLVSLLISLLYSLSLASLPISAFKDRANYLRYAEFGSQIFERYSDAGLLPLLANEPLWLFVNALIGQALSPEWTVRAIIFVSAFTVCFTLLRRYSAHVLLLTLFLLSPQIIKDFIIHLRQGLGLSVFLIGYFASPVWIRILLLMAAGLIHSSFYIVSAIWLTTLASVRLTSRPLARLIIVIGLFGIGVLSLIEIANLLGARQALRYAEATVQTSGLGFLLWAGMFLVFLSSGTKFLQEHMFPMSLLGCYLIAYFLTPLAARIFESGLPLVLSAGLFLRPLRKLVFISIFLFYGSYMYISASGSPWLGWGL